MGIPNEIRVEATLKPDGNRVAPERFRAWRSGGLLALNFIRRAELSPCTTCPALAGNVSAEHSLPRFIGGTPAIANPLVSVVFLSVVLVIAT
ncbi:MAG: hypothetical protein RIQ89_1510 [Bacteroidota bacterium]|jgi:hypothetical protein